MNQPKRITVALKVGDKVRTADGLNGEILLLAADGETAYVQIKEDGPGDTCFALSLGSANGDRESRLR